MVSVLSIPQFFFPFSNFFNNQTTPPSAMAATTAETIQTPTHTFFNVNTSNVTKLTSTNYLMWSLQIHALLDGYDLAG